MPRNPVRLLDLLVALGGVVVLVGLGLEWNDGSGNSGYSSPSVLRILLILAAIAGVALPALLAMTRKTDLPVVWEAFLAPVASVLFIIVGLKVILGAGDGTGTGMMVAAAGLLVLSAACWKALSRET